MAAPEELGGLLEAWLPGQRWFAGKGRPSRVVALIAAGILTERPWRSDLWLVRVRHADDGATETYQVPLVRRPQPADQVAHVLVGETPDPDYGGRSWWYDALHDKEVTGAWLSRHRRRPHRRRAVLPPRPGRRRAAAGGDQPADRRRAEQHLGGLRRRRDPQGVPPGLAGPQPGHRGARGAVPGGRRRPARRPAARATCRAHWTGRRRGTTTTGRPGHAAGVLPHRHRRLGAGHDQRPRPLRRGRPARRRGRRRLRRRGAPARRGHRGGARRPGPGAAAPPSWARTSWPRWPDEMRRRLDAAVAAVPELEPYADGLRAAFDALADARPCRCRCSGCTATSTSARCCAPRTGGWCSTSRASRPSRWPSGPGSTRRCGTSPGCCARSTTRPGTCCRPPGRAAAGLPRGGVGGAQPRGVLRRLRRGGRAGPAHRPGAAAGVRDGQGGLRGGLRGPQPAVLAADPARLAGPADRRSASVTSDRAWPPTRPD